jgi:hypothetical protein
MAGESGAARGHGAKLWTNALPVDDGPVHCTPRPHQARQAGPAERPAHHGRGHGDAMSGALRPHSHGSAPPPPGAAHVPSTRLCLPPGRPRSPGFQPGRIPSARGIRPSRTLGVPPLRAEGTYGPGISQRRPGPGSGHRVRHPQHTSTVASHRVAQSPVTCHTSPVTSHTSPVIGHPSPFASGGSPTNRSRGHPPAHRSDAGAGTRTAGHGHGGRTAGTRKEHR